LGVERVFIDGAHVLGQIPLDLTEMAAAGVDYYVGLNIFFIFYLPSTLYEATAKYATYKFAGVKLSQVALHLCERTGMQDSTPDS
jgi:hypothetical protein